MEENHISLNDLIADDCLEIEAIVLYVLCLNLIKKEKNTLSQLIILIEDLESPHHEIISDLFEKVISTIELSSKGSDHKKLDEANIFPYHQ